MNVLIVEPYYTGSHAAWARGYRNHSRHEVEILSLSGCNWKWRMHGGAVTLSRRLLASGSRPDVIVATDMLDLTTFLALTRSVTASIPTALYFHENQLSYPWSPTDRDVLHKRDKHYGFINYASAMAADAVFFNSRYHMGSFFDELERLLKHFPDHNELGSIDGLKARSGVLRLGLDLRRFDEHRGLPPGYKPQRKLVLWNHRWEYDKNPEQFFTALISLSRSGCDFDVAVLGENFSQRPEVFDAARRELGDRVVQFGFSDNFDTYARWLHAADVLPVTSNQDFFGGSVAEAVYCGCRPLLPVRLAYPELIPQAFNQEVFYNTAEEFEERLLDMLSEGGSGAPEGLRDAVASCDWATMAPAYDDTLETLLENQ